MEVLIEYCDTRRIYMDFMDVRDRVKMGEEFKFYVKEVGYWISRNRVGYYLTRESDSCSQSFASSEELFEHGTIDGTRLKDIWHQLERDIISERTRSGLADIT